MRFTKPSIASLRLPADRTELIVFDDNLPGFGIRLRAGGKRTWIVQYRLGTKQRRLTLGRVDALDLDRARLEARKVLAKAGLAIDPQVEKTKAKAETAIVLGPLFDRYLRYKEARLRPNSLRETRRYLEVAFGSLHRLPLSGISRSEVANLLSSIALDSGPVAADRARAALSAFFTWAMKEGIAAANPVIATNRHAPPVSRDRVLSDAELSDIWNACADDDFGNIVKLLILTGQRREEVAGMSWSELHLEKALWSLPAGRTKNHRPHDVPLSEQVLLVIKGVPARAERDMLFGRDDGSFSGWSKAKAALDKRIAKARTATRANDASGGGTVSEWRLHDLRRTVATRMADLGVEPHVIEAVLNHVSGVRSGVAGIYNRALYSAEKRSALQLWGKHIEHTCRK
jgi:integrase